MSENETPSPDFPDDKEHLYGLFQIVKAAFERGETMTFKIEEAREKGFVVKIGGLFGFVSYNHMPWSYPLLSYWHSIAPHLIGKVYKGKVHQLDESRLSILIDAKVHVFQKPELQYPAYYRGIVVNKADYGLFIDLGHHFDWQYGSFLGLAHHTNMNDPADYEHLQEGDEVKILLQGYNDKGQMVLGDKVGE